MFLRYAGVVAILAIGGCREGRRIVKDQTTPLQQVAVAPAPALMFEVDSARVYFDTTASFALAAAALADTSMLGARGQRYRGWPDSARKAFAGGAATFRIRDAFVADHLMSSTPFALYDTRHHTWASGVTKNVFAFTCGSLCGEAHDRFRFADGSTFLDLVTATQ